MYLEVRTSPLEVLDLALDFNESLALFMELLQLLLLLKKLLLIQLLSVFTVVIIQCNLTKVKTHKKKYSQNNVLK